MTTEQKIDKIAEELREIYKTNEGPRLIADMMDEFPNPRRVWNDKSDTIRGIKAGWGMPATCTAVS